MTIPPELASKIDEAISHYPVSKRSASLPLLHLWQEHFGWISNEAITWIAAKLELHFLDNKLISRVPKLGQTAREGEKKEN